MKLIITSILLASLSIANLSAQVTITPEHEAAAEAILKQMTLSEKIGLIGSEKSFYTRAIPRLEIPQIRMADGPQGIRNNTQSTMYPCGILTASTWNRDLAERLGHGLGQDAKARGVSILLGPGVNIYRAPMCGRNFEYFGEDPYLTGETAKHYILGVQAEGVMATVKHFAANNQEWIRQLADRRAGSADENYRKAWEVMYEKVLKDISGNRSAMLAARPALNGASKWSKTYIMYKNDALLEAWKWLAASSDHNSPSWKFDCVNIPRQCLENCFGRMNNAMLKAYKAGDKAKVKELVGMMTEILDDVDKLVAADSYFLLGKWINDARAWGKGFGLEDYYERDARNIITTWGGRGQKLNDYANRTYAGMVADYYKPRWEMYFDAILTAMENGKPVDEDALLNQILDYEWAWVSQLKKYPDSPKGKPGKMCRELYQKWSDKVAKYVD